MNEGKERNLARRGLNVVDPLALHWVVEGAIIEVLDRDKSVRVTHVYWIPGAKRMSTPAVIMTCFASTKRNYASYLSCPPYRWANSPFIVGILLIHVDIK